MFLEKSSMSTPMRHGIAPFTKLWNQEEPARCRSFRVRDRPKWKPELPSVFAPGGLVRPICELSGGVSWQRLSMRSNLFIPITVSGLK